MSDIPLASASDALAPRSTAFCGGNRDPQNVLYTTQNGGSKSRNEKWAKLSTDGSAGAVADAELATRRINPIGGKTILTGMVGQMGSGNFSGWDNDASFGFRDSITWDDDNIAVFDLSAEKVRVDVDGTDYEADIGLQPFKSATITYLSILIDFDIDTTEFYIETDPFTGSPVATIDHQPTENGDPQGLYTVLRSPGAHHVGNGSGTTSEDLLVGMMDIIPFLP